MLALALASLVALADPATVAAPVVDAPCGQPLNEQTEGGLRAPHQRWPKLKAKTRGLLLANPSRWGTQVGWSGEPPASNATSVPTYWYVTGPDSPFALYFAGLAPGTGVNGMPQWTVPVARGKRSRPYDAAMVGPQIENPWGLTDGAHIVELEVNSGDGGGEDVHFVATKTRIVEGTRERPLRAGAAIDAMAAHFQRCLDRPGASLAEAMARAREAHRGHRPPSAKEDLTGQAYEEPRLLDEQGAETTRWIRAFWDEPTKRLHVVLGVRVRGGTRYLVTERIVHHCPPGAPCLPPRIGTREVVVGWGTDARAAYVADATGVVTHLGFNAPLP